MVRNVGGRHLIYGQNLSNESVTPDADPVVLDLPRGEPMANVDSSAAKHTLKRQVVLKLRDPLGIAFGMAEHIPDLVDDLRRLSAGSSASDEVATVLDELAHTADLIKSNITRALSLVERDSLRASERWRASSDE
jgi:hypothetical protein